MLSQVPAQPMNPVDQEHEASMAKQQQKQTKEETSGATLLKLKQIL
jgi:hypothetical protein